MIAEDALRSWVAEGKTLWQIMALVPCSRNTVLSYLVRYAIEKPKGFHRREGRKTGRKAGFHQTEAWKEMMRQRFSGEGNPAYGTRHTLEAKKKMSGPRPSISGDKNPFRRAYLASAEAQEAHKERARRRWASYTPEQRNAIRERFSEARSRNEYHRTHASFKNHQHGFHDSPKAGRIFYRSGWELTVALFMDDCPYVLHYQAEPFSLPYVDEENLRRHTKPDFLAFLESGHQLLMEVKPEALMDWGDNRRKIEGQRRYCQNNGVQHAVLTGKLVMSVTALEALFQAASRGELYVRQSE